ncbi:flavodoxin family protein [Jeotgalibacillus haloalkalitolerans]|uniref:NAD(P)H-dependent oxidoreductase n=1 Tax=Jeotgalibacillus haloalkalitolerans TaxID=3104292 RepID=A0ABU5KPL5_9BACL|nr:NAD(P)H-dependent oxidoreductase [Jeotgalibacillus sp. HH7-29]MDZ5713125.1 NAD(P)H-dependent oxidoreductase [Jeotgalibacillus sp. HH7-29]
MTLLIISGSSREHSNSEYFAEKAAATYQGEVKWIRLRELTIHQIHDQRHDSNGFDPVDDDHAEVVKAMLDADEVLFVTPLYWYGMSGYMKTFIDRWSQAMRQPELNFKERIAGKPGSLITCGGDQVDLKGLPLILQFKHIFDFTGMDFKKYFIGEARKPGDAEKSNRLNQLEGFFN